MNDEPTLFDPVTPYDGGTSSGHSGSDASRERSERRDHNGQTATVQSQLLTIVRELGSTGLTVAEARSILSDHHGTVSGALSNLHKDGQLARLQDKRDHCHLYVVPEKVNGRETRPQGRNRPAAVVRLSIEERHAVDNFRHQIASGVPVHLGPTTARVLRDVLDRLFPEGS